MEKGFSLSVHEVRFLIYSSVSGVCVRTTWISSGLISAFAARIASILSSSYSSARILAASSKAVLEKQIALYRDGKGASADFGSFALGANDLLRIKLAKVGENVKKSIPDPAMLQELNGFVPDADKLVLGLGAVELALSASADGKDAKLDLAVETASDADADKLRTLAKSGLMPLTAMVKGSKDDGMKLAAGVLQAAKIAGEGKVANLSVAYAADDLIKFVSEQKKNALK